MNGRWAIGIIAISVLVGAGVFAFYVKQAEKIDRVELEVPKLVILSYSTFVSSFGPGPALAQQFEKTCNCEVELVNVVDTGLIIEKLNSDPDVRADLIVGLDQFYIDTHGSKMQWKPLQLNADEIQFVKPVADLVTEKFVPYDWAPMTFIYRDGEWTPPSELRHLPESLKGRTLSLQDPRTSTPGLQFSYWLYELGPQFTSEWLSNLASQSVLMSPSWSQSYGLFKRGTAQVVFSYLTSVVFHWEKENDRSYRAAQFKDGHPFQVEFAAIPERCKECELASQFARFLLQPESQKIVMERNFMLPVVKGVERDSIFASLPNLPLTTYKKLDEFLEQKDQLNQNLIENFR